MTGLKQGLLNFNGSEHQPLVSLVTAANKDAMLARASLARGGSV
jgi:hypothetical protein